MSELTRTQKIAREMCEAVNQRFHPKPMTIEQKVCEKIASRAELGLRKYGTTMQRTDLSRLQWLQHAQEEAMDLAVYLQKLIELEHTHQ